VLKRQANNYESVVRDFAQSLHDLAGPRDAVAFLLDQIENEPAWLRYNNRDGWSQHGWTIAMWWQEAKDRGDLEGRLLKLVLAELRRDLETRQQHNRSLYTRQSHLYWAEKENAFAKVAEEVLARQKESGPAAQYLAEYFYFGLGRGGRAIDILLAAHQQKVLDEGGQVQLVDYLHRENRHGESIPLLQPLVVRRPENLSYRVLLLRAYFRADRHGDLLTLLKDTDAFFHQKDRWTEGVMASLGASCLENQLYAQSAAYYNEAIPLHQRTAPRRGIGDGVLSGYYTQLAHAYAGLHKTAEAVDAAGGAVVGWGPDQAQRAQALETLKQVLQNSPDLDAYVVHLNRESAETGRDKAVVRKALGQVYLTRGQYPQAIAQLQVAAELQPNDAEINTLLVTAYDNQGDKEGAVAQLLQSVQLSRREIKLYQDLGRRLEALGRPEEAERANTSIVEVLPTEAESYALLAEVRERQNRLPEAGGLWERVIKLRSSEPTGLLKLAAVQIRQQKWEEAEKSIRQLNAKSWPPRFGDVAGQVRQLEQQLEKGRGK
jgi:tetratricopeptide (TPR) repeat protein